MQLTGRGVNNCSTSRGVITIWWASVKYKWQTLDWVLMRCELWWGISKKKIRFKKDFICVTGCTSGGGCTNT